MTHWIDPRLLISQVLLALAVGSGEILFWPKLAVEMTSAILWVAILAVGAQVVVNAGIARVTIGRRRHVLEAFLGDVPRDGRRWLAGLMLVLFVGPWLVPGWALQGSQVLVHGLVREGYADPAAADGLTRGLTVASILACGVLLFLPPRAFDQAVRPVQSVLMIVIVCFAVLLAAVTFTADGWAACAGGLASPIPWPTEARGAALLVSGFVFAGLGGSLNLGYSDYLREAGYGRGDPRAAYRLATREHFVLFGLGNAATIFLFALIAVMAFHAAPLEPSGDFLDGWTDRIRGAGGTWGQSMALIFIVMVYLIFLTSELGIIDVVSRLAAQLLVPLVGRGRATRKGLVAVLVAVLLVTLHLFPKPPLAYLTFSGWGNTAAMFLYSFLLLFQFRRLAPALRPSVPAALGTGLAAAVYLACFVLLIAFTLRG
jgi:hypothetical protein